jgi:glycosyltransferase involved in cell wall biosynthesis
MRRKNILIACDAPVWSGGFIRFERFGQVARLRGHSVSFLAFRPDPSHNRQIDFPVITFDQAASDIWDATMIPGAGFDAATITQFSNLTADSFGYRIQHILNDQTRRAAFLAVNCYFRPHLIIFNNQHWSAGSFTDFQAGQFRFLEGAVDTARFHPETTKSSDKGQKFIVGGLASKNSAPLIEAARQLDDIELRLFGHAGNLDEAHADLVQTEKLQLTGLLDDNALAAFYRKIDCVVHTEEFAGWANLAAETLAAGVPLICTPHGTKAFAVNNVTALVMSKATTEAIVRAIKRLRDDPALRMTLSVNGREAVLPFTWEHYTDALLSLMDEDRTTTHYTHAPQLNLHGKWPIDVRLQGLDFVLRHASGRSVLDLGCAEGIISKALLDSGATFVHGIERDPSRVKRAREICTDIPRARFDVADLSDWDASSNILNTDGYDIVLYLGLHHHLPRAVRRQTCLRAAELAKYTFAIRTSDDVYDVDNISSLLNDLGFPFEQAIAPNQQSGQLRVFTRMPPSTVNNPNVP